MKELFFDREVYNEILLLKANGKLELDKKELRQYSEYFNRKRRKWRLPKK